jgi:hypothetical protein
MQARFISLIAATAVLAAASVAMAQNVQNNQTPGQETAAGFDYFLEIDGGCDRPARGGCARTARVRALRRRHWRPNRRTNRGAGQRASAAAGGREGARIRRAKCLAAE